MTNLDGLIFRFGQTDCGSTIFSAKTRASIYKIYEDAKNMNFTVQTTRSGPPMIFANGIKLDFANFLMLYSHHHDIIQSQKEQALMGQDLHNQMSTMTRLLGSNDNMQNNHWHMLGKTHAYQMKAMEMVQQLNQVNQPTPDQNNTTLILVLTFTGLTLLVLAYTAFYLISNRRKQVQQPASEEAKVTDITI